MAGRPGVARQPAAQQPAAPQPAAQLTQAELARHPAQLNPRPDQERLGLEGRQGNPRGIHGAGEDEETRLPLRAELGVELIQRLDLEPAGGEQQQ